MEEALLAREVKDKKGKVTWSASLAEELNKVSYIAAPMVAVSVLRYLLQAVSVMMAGHLDELSLSGVAIANSFTAVTGFSLIFGMVGALETLCGQAYGAGQYRKLGIYTNGSIVVLTLVCLPVSLLWIFEERLLVLLGQDPSVSKEAGRYSIFLLPALFAYAVLLSLVRYLQTQGLTFAMLISFFIALCFHIPLCWALVYRFELGTAGAALSLSLSHWFCVMTLAIYIKCSSVCDKTRPSFTIDVFLSIREYMRFAVPSAIMACLEWWSFELLILVAGTLPNSKLETSVLSICYTTTSLHFLIAYGISAAASTRVSNQLGAGNPKAAQAAVYAGVILTVVEAVIVGIILFCCRSVLGYAYSNEKEVVDYVKEIAPLLSLSVLVDGLQTVFCGIARGSGWQHLGAYVNLAAYYLVGIPLALVLCYALHLRGVGLWIGLLTGSTVQALLLALLTSFTNWQRKAIEARERIFEQTRADSSLS